RGLRRPPAAPMRGAGEDLTLPRRFVQPIGYLDVHMTPFGHRILPVLARVRPGFTVRFNKGEVDDAFEVPLAFLMTPQNHKRESRNWNGLTIRLYAMPFGGRNIWGATAGILRNLYERVYQAGQCGSGAMSQCPLWVTCGRRLGKNFLTLLQHWSGAVTCPACLCGGFGRWP